MTYRIWYRRTKKHLRDFGFEPTWFKPPVSYRRLYHVAPIPEHAALAIITGIQFNVDLPKAQA